MKSPDDRQDGTATEAAAHLAAALNHLLTARILCGGLPDDEVPGAALDATLRHSEDYLAARQALRAAWDTVMVHVPGGETSPDALALEEAVNHLSSTVANVAYRLSALLAGANRT